MLYVNTIAYSKLINKHYSRNIFNNLLFNLILLIVITKD